MTILRAATDRDRHRPPVQLVDRRYAGLARENAQLKDELYGTQQRLQAVVTTVPVVMVAIDCTGTVTAASGLGFTAQVSFEEGMAEFARQHAPAALAT